MKLTPLLAALVLPVSAATNVVFIMADDLGYMDVGFNNPETFYDTPRLNALARQSMRFTAGYAAYRFEFLKPYQLERILTFLNPDRDPLGQGYHLLQSKTGIGSGGLTGKGFMEGTQAQLKFLPEMHTDFIFTVFGEEFGFVGAIGLLLLYLAVILTGLSIAMSAKSHFARLASIGVVATFSLYVLINTGMVMGLAPVVGVPLPLVSYGGTVMLTIMAGFGLVMSAHVNRDSDSWRSSDLS